MPQSLRTSRLKWRAQREDAVMNYGKLRVASRQLGADVRDEELLLVRCGRQRTQDEFPAGF